MRLTSYHFNYTQSLECKDLFKYSVSFDFEHGNTQEMLILNAFAQGLRLKEPLLIPYPRTRNLYATYYSNDMDILKRLINIIEYTYTK